MSSEPNHSESRHTTARIRLPGGHQALRRVDQKDGGMIRAVPGQCGLYPCQWYEMKHVSSPTDLMQVPPGQALPGLTLLLDPVSLKGFQRI